MVGTFNIHFCTTSNPQGQGTLDAYILTQVRIEPTTAYLLVVELICPLSHRRPSIGIRLYNCFTVKTVFQLKFGFKMLSLCFQMSFTKEGWIIIDVEKFNSKWSIGGMRFGCKK